MIIATDLTNTNPTQRSQPTHQQNDKKTYHGNLHCL